MASDENGSGGRDGHILHFPQPFRFEADKDYDFLRRGALKTSWHNMIRRFGELVLTPVLRLLFGFEISGAENIDVFDSRGAIVVCNHVAVMDCTFIEFAFPYKRTYFTTLESNFRIPIARHLIRWLGGLPIPKRTSAVTEFQRAAMDAARSGDCVVFYPEGVLYPYYNGLRKFSPGAFKIACGSGVPVIPAVITFRHGRGLFALKRGPCVTLTILPAAEPEGDTREAAVKLQNVCRDRMEKAIARINAGEGVSDDPYEFIHDRKLRRTR